MNFKNIIIGAFVALASVSASAQEQVKTVEVFNPHWYVQGQVGGQYTLGEVKFDKLLSPNAQVGVGYQFNPVLGARLSVNGWQSKGGSKIFGERYGWKYNYVAPTVDVTVDLTNLIMGYKYDRLVNVGIFAGIGANIGFKNDEAKDVKATLTSSTGVLAHAPEYMEYLWDGSKVLPTGHMGVNVDFRLSDAVSVGAEVSANFLSDKYNSKKAGNADWYFNALVGVKYNFGKTHTSKTITTVVPCEPKVIEKIVEKIVEKPAPAVVAKEVKREPLRRDIFFLIRGSVISQQEMKKVVEIVDYLKKYPDAKVVITGYADKGTGNPKINMGYSQKRAKVVADTLMKQYGISADRITYSAKGDTEQPYENQPLNRVSICIAE